MVLITQSIEQLRCGARCAYVYAGSSITDLGCGSPFVQIEQQTAAIDCGAMLLTGWDSMQVSV